MLRPDDELEKLTWCEHARPYSGPLLQRGSEGLREVVALLDRAGLIVYNKVRRGLVGIFTVKKKDGSQRLIFDCRLINRMFRDPPWTALSLPVTLGEPAGLCF